MNGTLPCDISEPDKASLHGSLAFFLLGSFTAALITRVAYVAHVLYHPSPFQKALQEKRDQLDELVQQSSISPTSSFTSMARSKHQESTPAAQLDCGISFLFMIVIKRLERFLTNHPGSAKLLLAVFLIVCLGADVILATDIFQLPEHIHLSRAAGVLLGVATIATLVFLLLLVFPPKGVDMLLLVALCKVVELFVHHVPQLVLAFSSTYLGAQTWRGTAVLSIGVHTLGTLLFAVTATKAVQELHKAEQQRKVEEIARSLSADNYSSTPCSPLTPLHAKFTKTFKVEAAEVRHKPWRRGTPFTSSSTFDKLTLASYITDTLILLGYCFSPGLPWSNISIAQTVAALGFNPIYRFGNDESGSLSSHHIPMILFDIPLPFTSLPVLKEYVLVVLAIIEFVYFKIKSDQKPIRLHQLTAVPLDVYLHFPQQVAMYIVDAYQMVKRNFKPKARSHTWDIVYLIYFIVNLTFVINFLVINALDIFTVKKSIVNKVAIVTYSSPTMIVGLYFAYLWSMNSDKLKSDLLYRLFKWNTVLLKIMWMPSIASACSFLSCTYENNGVRLDSFPQSHCWNGMHWLLVFPSLHLLARESVTILLINHAAYKEQDYFKVLPLYTSYDVIYRVFITGSSIFFSEKHFPLFLAILMVTILHLIMQLRMQPHNVNIINHVVCGMHFVVLCGITSSLLCSWYNDPTNHFPLLFFIIGSIPFFCGGFVISRLLFNVVVSTEQLQAESNMKYLQDIIEFFGELSHSQQHQQQDYLPGAAGRGTLQSPCTTIATTTTTKRRTARASTGSEDLSTSSGHNMSTAIPQQPHSSGVGSSSSGAEPMSAGTKHTSSATGSQSEGGQGQSSQSHSGASTMVPPVPPYPPPYPPPPASTLVHGAPPPTSPSHLCIPQPPTPPLYDVHSDCPSPVSPQLGAYLHTNIPGGLNTSVKTTLSTESSVQPLPVLPMGPPVDAAETNKPILSPRTGETIGRANVSTSAAPIVKLHGSKFPAHYPNIPVLTDTNTISRSNSISLTSAAVLNTSSHYPQKLDTGLMENQKLKLEKILNRIQAHQHQQSTGIAWKNILRTKGSTTASHDTDPLFESQHNTNHNAAAGLSRANSVHQPLLYATTSFTHVPQSDDFVTDTINANKGVHFQRDGATNHKSSRGAAAPQVAVSGSPVDNTATLSTVVGTTATTSASLPLNATLQFANTNVSCAMPQLDHSTSRCPSIDPDNFDAFGPQVSSQSLAEPESPTTTSSHIQHYVISQNTLQADEEGMTGVTVVGGDTSVLSRSSGCPPAVSPPLENLVLRELNAEQNKLAQSILLSQIENLTRQPLPSTSVIQCSIDSNTDHIDSATSHSSSTNHNPPPSHTNISSDTTISHNNNWNLQGTNADLQEQPPSPTHTTVLLGGKASTKATGASHHDDTHIPVLSLLNVSSLSSSALKSNPNSQRGVTVHVTNNGTQSCEIDQQQQQDRRRRLEKSVEQEMLLIATSLQTEEFNDNEHISTPDKHSSNPTSNHSSTYAVRLPPLDLK